MSPGRVRAQRHPPGHCYLKAGWTVTEGKKTKRADVWLEHPWANPWARPAGMGVTDRADTGSGAEWARRKLARLPAEDDRTDYQRGIASAIDHMMERDGTGSGEHPDTARLREVREYVEGYALHGPDSAQCPTWKRELFTILDGGNG